MRRRRLRTWAKWACTLAALLCVGAAVFGGCFNAYWSIENKDRGRRWDVAATSGLLWLYSFDIRGRPLDESTPRCHAELDFSWRWGLASEEIPSGELWGWHAGVSRLVNGGSWTVGISAVYPVLLTTIPAAILWYKDRRRFGPHQCGRCGYDRSGIDPHSKCPECGTAPTGG